MTATMEAALGHLRRARKDDPNTDDGIVANCATFYDVEVAVAYVHWKTAEALEREGLIEYGDSDPGGTAITLREDFA